MLALNFLIDLAVVDHLLFVGRGRRKEHAEIVALLRGDLSRSARIDLAD